VHEFELAIEYHFVQREDFEEFEDWGGKS